MRLSPAQAALEARHGRPVEQIVVDAINTTGNVSAAARLLGVNVKTMHAWRVRFGIQVSVRAKHTSRRASRT